MATIFAGIALVADMSYTMSSTEKDASWTGGMSSARGEGRRALRTRVSGERGGAGSDVEVAVTGSDGVIEGIEEVLAFERGVTESERVLSGMEGFGRELAGMEGFVEAAEPARVNRVGASAAMPELWRALACACNAC